MSAWTLTLVYVSFAGAVCTATADEAQPAFGSLSLHLAWQVYAIIAFVLVMALAYLDIKVSARVILALEGASMLLVRHRVADPRAPGSVQQVAEIPSDTSRYELTRPLIMFAVVRAVVIAGTAGLAFGLNLSHGTGCRSRPCSRRSRAWSSPRS